jgi:hypothetical protein
MAEVSRDFGVDDVSSSWVRFALPSLLLINLSLLRVVSLMISSLYVSHRLYTIAVIT